MNESPEAGGSAREQALEAQILAMKRQVELRDELLQVLNRRLVQLERGEAETVGPPPSPDGNRAPGQAGVRGRVHSILDTGMFRWTVPARKLHGRIHARRRGSA